MTARSAWAAHRDNVALQGELGALKRRLRKLEEQTRCIYCGTPAPKGQRACVGHRDLLELDPAYAREQVAA